MNKLFLTVFLIINTLTLWSVILSLLCVIMDSWIFQQTLIMFPWPYTVQVHSSKMFKKYRIFLILQNVPSFLSNGLSINKVNDPVSQIISEFVRQNNFIAVTLQTWAEVNWKEVVKY
jgi:hypothetical protein